MLTTRWLVVLLIGAMTTALLPAAAASHDESQDPLDDALKDEFENGLRTNDRETFRMLDGLLGTNAATGFGDLPGTFSESRTTRVTTTQDVTLDEDTVFLAIALGDSVSIRDLANVDARVEREFTLDRTVDLDRDDALLVVALGGGHGQHGDFTSVRDVSVDAELVDEVRRDVSLDEDTVFLALALDRGVDLQDVLILDEEVTHSRDFSGSSDLDRDDAFTLLFLGEN